MSVSAHLLDDLFGLDSHGSTPEERARSSKRLFVRSIDQIAQDSPTAAGRRLTATEAMDAYGWGVLQEVAADGTALIAADSNAAGRTLRTRRQALGLTTRQVARRARVDIVTVEAAEQSRRLPIREYEKIARAIGLDERLLSFRPDPHGSDEIVVRLRTLGDDEARINHSTVTAISEAAWIATTQIRLEERLGLRARRLTFEPSSNYGSPGYPAYAHGYYLAFSTREKLGVPMEPIQSMREVCEERFAIPVVQTYLEESVAGVTLELGSTRAIVLNLAGRNKNPLIRRATLAHELGHILHDPSRELQALRVDGYDELEREAHSVVDRVEQRANAFAVEFIAPRAVAVDLFHREGLAAVVNTLGISFTAARYQVWNALEREIPLDSLRVAGDQDQSWEAREAFTIDWNPLGHIREARAGKFCAVVVRAAQESLISWDTAAAYLDVSESEVQTGSSKIRDFYPTVFPST